MTTNVQFWIQLIGITGYIGQECLLKSRRF